MDNAQSTKKIVEGIDLYKNQQIYEMKIARKRTIYSWAFAVISILSLIVYFIEPMYSYRMIAKSQGEVTVKGDFVALDIVNRFFTGHLTDVSIFNVCLIVILIAITVSAIYLVAGAVLNLFCKNTVKENKLISKLFNYGFLEVIASIQLVFVLLSMLFCKIDVSGKADNGNAFWLVMIFSAAMVCLSISLSSNNK